MVVEAGPGDPAVRQQMEAAQQGPRWPAAAPQRSQALRSTPGEGWRQAWAREREQTRRSAPERPLVALQQQQQQLELELEQQLELELELELEGPPRGRVR